MNRNGNGQRLVRVVVVDDDDINRRGMASLLHDAAEIEVVAAVSHAQALQVGVPWASATSSS